MPQYVIFTEKPSMNSMSFNPSIPLIDTYDIQEYVNSLETKYDSKYRYYATPGIYQRDKSFGEVESIMTLDRFARNWYLQYSTLIIDKNDINVIDEELLTELYNVKNGLFTQFYPDIIQVLKDEYCSIKKIALGRDDMGINMITIDFNDKSGVDSKVVIVRKD